MSEPTSEEIRAVLADSARAGEVFPSILKTLLSARSWTGRQVCVLRVVTSDIERMRFLAGGSGPDEVADAVLRWADTTIPVDDLDLVFAAGGYDPDPFATLAAAGVLRDALVDETGAIRHVDGERVGTWISDELALTSADETLARVRRLVDAA